MTSLKPVKVTVAFPSDMEISSDRAAWYLEHAIRGYWRNFATETDPIRGMRNCAVVVQSLNHTQPLQEEKATQQEPVAYGWVAYNSGPCEWFWSEVRSSLEHELTDDIRPATALEKYLLSRQGNQTWEHTSQPDAQAKGWDLVKGLENGTIVLNKDMKPVKKEGHE